MQLLSVDFLQSKCGKVPDAKCSRSGSTTSVHMCTFREPPEPSRQASFVGTSNRFRKPQCRLTFPKWLLNKTEYF